MSLPDFNEQAQYIQRLSLEMYARDLSLQEKIAYQTGLDEITSLVAKHFNNLHIPRRKSQTNQWVVHPTCAEIDFGKIPTEIENLILNLKTKNNTNNRILVADPIHYALKDYALVEQGLFEHVIFTHSSEGIPLQFDYLDQFKASQKNLVMGCYTDECVKTFSQIIDSNINANSQIIRYLSFQPEQESFAVYNAIYSNLPKQIKKIIPPPKRENYTKP